jgi:argininosuccinate lyase
MTPENTNWPDRIDRIHEIGCSDWLTGAWIAMLIRQGIVPEQHAHDVARVTLEMLDDEIVTWREGYFYRRQEWLVEQLGEEAGGSLMIGRTVPPGEQMLTVRWHLMKSICQILDMQDALLDASEEHAGAIMPGYTHTRHAQPTTFGHYLLSVLDAVIRSAETVESGYHSMNLNEMGAGALAGTSFPIDRDLVSEYLGMDGLIENANDAVSYTDGYLVVVSGLVNIANAVSRMATDLAYWSGDEFGFLEMGTHGVSFMMPQKSTNPNSLERVRLYAGQMIGSLTSVAVAGLREPQADTHAMLHLEDATLQAIELAGRVFPEVTGEMRKMQVHEDRMREVVKDSYIASTELANEMVREYEVDYRTGHEIIKRFVRASEAAGIPASQARAEMLEEIAKDVIGRTLGMTDERLRELLDPAHFIEVTDSRGGVAPQEMARMIADRREKLKAAGERHLARIETLEQAQKKMVADLKAV